MDKFLASVDDFITKPNWSDCRYADNQEKVRLALSLAGTDWGTFNYMRRSGLIDSAAAFPLLTLVRKYLKAQGGLSYAKSVITVRNSRKRFCEMCGEKWVKGPDLRCWHCREFQEWYGD